MLVSDDVPGKSKKNSINMPKHTNFSNEGCTKIDTNIVLVHEGNIRSSIFENHDLLSHQIVLQPNGSNLGQSTNFENTVIVQGNNYEIKKLNLRYHLFI